MNITIKVRNLEDLQEVLGAAPRQVSKASNFVVRNMVKDIRKEIVTDITNKFDIPRSGFRRIRTRQKTNRGRGRVWTGYNRIRAAYLGDLKEDARGAFAGSYFFPKAFIHKFGKHETLVVSDRTNSVKGRLIEQTANLIGADRIVRHVADKHGPLFMSRIRDRLIKEVSAIG